MEAGNDRLAALCSGRDDAAFAALGSHPSAAARELERCVTRLRMLGGTLHVATGDIRDRIAANEPVFEAAQALGVPLHLAPAGSPGYGWSSAVTEALVTSGCLVRYGDLAIIIGQADDELAWSLAGIDQRLAGVGAGRRASEQVRAAVFYTTSGLNYHPALRDLVGVLGSDRILYASDRPFAYDQAAVAAAMPLPPRDVERIMRGNAESLFKLL